MAQVITCRARIPSRDSTMSCRLLRVTLVALSLLSAAVAEDRHDDAYDFVIVGGGLAGSVLANRLSECGRHSVLLLNVAGAPPKAYSGPVMLTDEFIVRKNISANDGLRVSIQQPGYGPVPHFSTALTGSSPARMLGGSSLVALSLYLRDHPEALDSWGRGWSWEDLRPYFYRAEGLQGSSTALKESDYGQDGPYTVQELPAYTHPLTQEFIRAAKAAGLPWSPDLNTERGSGVGLTPTTQRADGSKVHAFDAYLKPALGRPNLEVMHGARADRLLIKDNICHGVAYRNLEKQTDHVVHARKEVIVSSGYVYSPRLLFLSGLGARRGLEAVGLQVVKDLPAVGRNLTAARFSPLAWRTSEPTLSQMMGAPISGSGHGAVPVSYSSAVLEATARTRSAAGARADPQAKRPDIVLSFMPLFYSPTSAPMQYSLQGEDWPLKTNAFSILATLGETKAQGSVTFPSGAPDVSPLVTHEAMTDPEDLARAEEAIELARKIGGSSEFRRSGGAVANRAGEPDMWTAVYDGRGTCRMGEQPHDSVVDHQLRVHGITSLRVVDGSVIPVASPYLAVPEVLALAERASELILNEHAVEARENSAAALLAGSPDDDAVTIEHLAAKLGDRFSMMQAVYYLAGAPSAEFIAQPLVTEAFSRVLELAFGLAVAALAAAAVARGRSRAGNREEAGYLVLSA